MYDEELSMVDMQLQATAEIYPITWLSIASIGWQKFNTYEYKR